jgi:hypothetical protein
LQLFEVSFEVFRFFYSFPFRHDRRHTFKQTNSVHMYANTKINPPHSVYMFRYAIHHLQRLFVEHFMSNKTVLNFFRGKDRCVTAAS